MVDEVIEVIEAKVEIVEKAGKVADEELQVPIMVRTRFLVKERTFVVDITAAIFIVAEMVVIVNHVNEVNH